MQNLAECWQRLCRRAELLPSIASWWRCVLLTARGARIGRGTRIPPRMLAPWPHQVQLGAHCVLQPDIFFNYDHFWTPGPSIILGDRVFVGRGVEFNVQGRIEIGEDALIASGCILVDHDHGIIPSASIKTQPSVIEPIKVGRGVWLGARVVVLKGVEIGDGAIIGAGSVVTKSVPPREIWCGVPARKVGIRGEDQSK